MQNSSANFKKLEFRLVEINNNWLLYKDLFNADSNYDVFNESAPLVWLLLREALLDSVFLGISRLMDGPTSCGQKNLSLMSLFEELAKQNDMKNFGGVFSTLKQNYNQLLKPWRDKILSHNDLDTHAGLNKLPDVPIVEIDRLVSEMNNIVRQIGIELTNCDSQYEPYVANSEWTWKLLRVLRNGLALQQ